jgi:hypothetical protein
MFYPSPYNFTLMVRGVYFDRGEGEEDNITEAETNFDRHHDCE